MRIGLISDLHANRQALAACLDHGRTRHIDQWAVLGDLVVMAQTRSGWSSRSWRWPMKGRLCSRATMTTWR